MCTDNTISVESIKTLYESEFPRHMKYHNPVKCMSDTHSFDIFSFKHKKNKILNNRKVVTQWDLSKSEVFSTTDHYSGRKTIKTENKQTVFLEDEPIIRDFRTIGKFLLKKSVFGVFLKFSYPEGVKSYIIKTFCWFLVEADQTYLIIYIYKYINYDVSILVRGVGFGRFFVIGRRKWVEWMFGCR